MIDDKYMSKENYIINIISQTPSVWGAGELPTRMSFFLQDKILSFQMQQVYYSTLYSFGEKGSRAID